VAEYARWGVAESHIEWDWWKPQKNGVFCRNFDMSTVRAYALADPIGDVIGRIGCLAQRMPMIVVRPGMQSINGDSRWARLRLRAPRARILVLHNCRHGLPPAGQEGAASRIATALLDCGVLRPTGCASPSTRP